MLNRILLTTVCFFSIVPAVVGIILSRDVESPTLQRIQNRIDQTVCSELCTEPKNLESDRCRIPDFKDWKSVKDIPQEYRTAFPASDITFLGNRSHRDFQSVFRRAATILNLRDDIHTPADNLARWRGIVRAAGSGLLYKTLDLSLRKELMDGLEIYLYLPGYRYFLEHAPEGSQEQRHLLSYGRTFSPDHYPTRPWLMRWYGDAVLERLDEEIEARSANGEKIAACLQNHLINWNSEFILPWLSLAFLTHHPSLVSPVHMEIYLRRTLVGDECPYMLNAAALYVCKTDTARIVAFMQDLQPHARLADLAERAQSSGERCLQGERDVGDQLHDAFAQQEWHPDAACLYWFMMEIVSSLGDSAVTAAVRQLESEWKGSAGLLAKDRRTSWDQTGKRIRENRYEYRPFFLALMIDIEDSDFSAGYYHHRFMDL